MYKTGAVATLSNDNNKLKIVSTSGTPYVLKNSIKTEIGKLYEVYMDVTLGTFTGMTVTISDNNGTDLNTTYTVSSTGGKQLIYFRAASNNVQIKLAPTGGSGKTGYVNFIEVKQTTEVKYSQHVTQGVSLTLTSRTGSPATYTAKGSIIFDDGFESGTTDNFETLIESGLPEPIYGYEETDEDYRFAFNGKEVDNETYGTGNEYDYGFRIYNPRLGKFLSVDPLTMSYPMLTPYQFASNMPIAGIDLDGLEFYYTADGKLLGKVGTSTEVRLVHDNDIKKVTQNIRDANNKKSTQEQIETAVNHANNSSTSLDITNQQLLAFAAVIDKESSGDKIESYALGNATMNFLDNGGSPGLKTLDDVTMYDNSFAQGATQSNYTSFMSKSVEAQNKKYAIGAAINAVGYSKGIQGFGFDDFSGNADSWDGIDLVQSTRTNSHRGYIWSIGSEDVVLEYKKSVNGGVNVGDWNYSNSGTQIEAKKQVGKTLFTDIKTGRGEGKQNPTKFK